MRNDLPASPSRRKFLRTAAAAGAAVVTADPAAAQDPRVVLDVAVLNYLLRVEYVQAELYREGLLDFTTAARIRQFDAYGGQATLDQLRALHEQDLSHQDILRSLVTRLGGTPLPRCTVTFARFATATNLMQTAFAIENVGVSAYLGVVPLLRIPQVQTAVAAIASVEARHSAYIGMLNGESPSPAAADTPRSREEVLGLLDPYIGLCSGQ
ncbi:MAG: ferritin-like domain-containing protein [Vicinamibacterales bacterium]